MTTEDNLEKMRDSRRKKYGRIAFDCFNLKVVDDEVYCIEGHSLTVGLLGILGGVTPRNCKSCQDYDGGK